jgi:hypothetical protein
LQSRYPIPPLVSGCASTCTSLPYKLNSSILPLGCVLPFLFFPFQPWSSNSKEKNSLTVIVEYQLPTFCPSSISHRPIKHPNSFLFRGQLLCSCSSLHRALSNQHQSISLTCMCLLFPWSFLCPPANSRSRYPHGFDAHSIQSAHLLPPNPRVYHSHLAQRPLFHFQTSLHHCWPLPTEGSDTIAFLNTCQ